MERILLLLHPEDDLSLSRSSLEALTATNALVSPGDTFAVGLAGSSVTAPAERIAGCGAHQFLAVESPELAASRYATDALAAETLCRAAQATLVLAPATARWNRVLPGVAQRAGGRADTHVTGVSRTGDQLIVSRCYYRQRMEAALERATRPWFLALEPGTHEAWAGPPGSATLERLALEIPENCKRTTVQGIRAPAQDAQTIRPDATLLFVTGAGWTKKQADGQAHAQEAERLILEFLGLTRASLGSSKSLVDLSAEGQSVLPFLTHLNQVGQTGSTPRHRKGLATCCHGEEPHTVGWRFITERRAISLDPNCGWARGKADVLYVADAFAVMRSLNALLGATDRG